jgi:hypothetical protein
MGCTLPSENLVGTGCQLGLNHALASRRLGTQAHCSFADFRGDVGRSSSIRELRLTRSAGEVRRRNTFEESITLLGDVLLGQ